jgi:hypothetical protein
MSCSRIQVKYVEVGIDGWKCCMQFVVVYNSITEPGFLAVNVTTKASYPVHSGPAGLRYANQRRNVAYKNTSIRSPACSEPWSRTALPVSLQDNERAAPFPSKRLRTSSLTGSNYSGDQ